MGAQLGCCGGNSREHESLLFLPSSTPKPLHTQPPKSDPRHFNPVSPPPGTASCGYSSEPERRHHTSLLPFNFHNSPYSKKRGGLSPLGCHDGDNHNRVSGSSTTTTTNTTAISTSSGSSSSLSSTSSAVCDRNGAVDDGSNDSMRVRALPALPLPRITCSQSIPIETDDMSASPDPVSDASSWKSVIAVPRKLSVGSRFNREELLEYLNELNGFHARLTELIGQIQLAPSDVVRAQLQAEATDVLSVTVDTLRTFAAEVHDVPERAAAEWNEKVKQLKQRTDEFCSTLLPQGSCSFKDNFERQALHLLESVMRETRMLTADFDDTSEAHNCANDAVGFGRHRNNASLHLHHGSSHSRLHESLSVPVLPKHSECGATPQPEHPQASDAHAQSALTTPSTAAALRAVGLWNFEIGVLARATDGAPLSPLLLHLVGTHQLDLARALAFDSDKLVGVVTAFQDYYFADPYYNAVEAADVVHTCYALALPLKAKFTPLELTALLISSCAHNFASPHLANLCLVDSCRPLTTSTLTTALAHESEVFEITQRWNQFTETVSATQQQPLRSLTVELVRVTGAALHFPHVAELQALLDQQLGPSETQAPADGANLQQSSQQKVPELDYSNDATRLIILKTIVKLADLLHACKQKHLTTDWASELTLVEQAQQAANSGVSEDNLALPIDSPHTRFIDRIVFPFMQQVCRFHPQGERMIGHIIALRLSSKKS
eukprot:gnl/Spiro4/5969_TR3057_c0_g1_i1.p1 gnl/Spiro4/5969_TR3057_c0_g1~~gnl/Spiro4/5969_TR3057_c0_g1_i1.p1  ORF type:complete len:722 (+),score=96.57 gnl/Spiro4/5969_TR3057_c0_g1_i1:86-2251(+)